jgi:hypothetical protein
MGGLTQRPERMTLANLETGDVITAQFNPVEIKESLGVNFERLEILGLSHKPLQYKNTDNLQIQFDLGFDAISERDVVFTTSAPADGDNVGVNATGGARKFLLHLCYPRKGAQDVSRGGPPRVYMFWPNLYALTCRIVKLELEHRRFALSMDPVNFTAKVSIEEASSVRIFSEDILGSGTLKGT